VRKGASNDLLVGTDVQPKLGHFVVARDDDGGMTDLFSGQPVEPEGWRQTRLGSNQEPKNDSVPTRGAEHDTAAPQQVPEDSRPRHLVDHDYFR
jgi:hypothetical protein